MYMLTARYPISLWYYIIETHTPGILRNILIDVMSCSKDNNCSQKLPFVVSAAAEGEWKMMF